jgi:Tol biopolymer transport system component
MRRFVLIIPMLIIIWTMLFSVSSVVAITLAEHRNESTLAFTSYQTSTHDANGDLYILDTTTRLKIRLTADLMDDISPVWSPDRQTIAFASAPVPGRSYDIYLIDIFTRQKTLVIENDANDQNPSWLPDGRHLLFSSNRVYLDDLYILDLDTNTVEIIDKHPARDTYPAASPDGTLMAFASNRHRGYDSVTFSIQLMNLETRQIQSLVDFPGSNIQPAWSADGHWIAYVVDDLETPYSLNVSVRNIVTDEVYLITDRSSRTFAPVWSPDAQHLAFSSDDNGNFEIYTIEIDASRNVGSWQPLTASPTLDMYPSWRPASANR